MFLKSASGVDHLLQTHPEGRVTVLALRRRSADHPMGMFAVIVGTAFFSMAVASSSGIAASPSAAARSELTSEMPSAPSKLPNSGSSAEVLCQGQGWGSETEACLAAIAQENGASREVRLIASAEPLTDIPNVF